MVNVVLVQKTVSAYDDHSSNGYHFPKQYFDRLKAAEGDWAIFYTPVKDTGVSPENRGSYFATVQLGSIRADPEREDHYYAAYMPETYADFGRPVPRIVDGHFLEPDLGKDDLTTNTGVALQSVRHISDEVFARIISLAWPDADDELPRVDPVDRLKKFGVHEDQLGFDHEVARDVVQQLRNRTIRDPRFRTAVLYAYGKKCAVTGWDFINGGGRAEVEAAHIRPVEHGGSDKIRNGIALSGTIHWMFDRGLIGIAENDDILISRKVNDRSSVERLINPTGKIVRPIRPEHQPHPEYLKWHREFHGFAAA